MAGQFRIAGAVARNSRAALCLLSLLALLVMLAPACSETPGPGAAAKVSTSAPHRHTEGAPPNVILVVLDTARADRTSLDGYDRMTTPAIDGMARDGVTYLDAHSVAPWTLPSHFSMFTGLFPGQHGANWRAFATPEDGGLEEILHRTFRLADPSLWLPKRLKDAGYLTVGFSSNAWISRRTGFDVDFDFFHEMWKERGALRKGYDDLDRRIRMSRDVDRADAGLVLMDFKRYALEQGGGLREPFFLFFNFIDPHYPYSPPKLWRYQFTSDVDLGERIAKFEFDEMGMQAGDQPVDVKRFSPFYDGEISYLDFVVGRLLDWLRERGYYDESLIVITSDHGEHLGEGGKFSHQFSVEEELLRVPLVVKYPGNERAGEVVRNPLVSNMDAYQTILARATPAASGDPVSMSVDLGDAGGVRRRFLLAEYYHSLPYLRASHRKYEGFSVEEHRVDRRVVYGSAARYVFEERDGVSTLTAVVGEEDAQERDQAIAFLNQYVASLGSGGVLEDTEQPLDPETIERLRSLGYVD